MHVYISADIEGVGCVVRGEQSSVKGRLYEEARRFMTGEVNAAIQGAFETGATEVTVCDAHNVGLNLIPEEMDDRAALILGGPRPLAMMEGVDAGADLVFFVGYHGMAGTADATIAHIFTGRIAEVRMNELRVGEIGINALLAGHFGAPVGMVAGDEAASREAGELLGDIETVAVKSGIGAYGGRCLHPKKCREMIFEAAARAVRRRADFHPHRMEGAVSLEVRMTTASAADRVLRMPGVARVDDVTVRFAGENVLEAFRAFNTMADLVELTHFV
jgi:D-amino peptidase